MNFAKKEERVINLLKDKHVIICEPSDSGYQCRTCPRNCGNVDTPLDNIPIAFHVLNKVEQVGEFSIEYDHETLHISPCGEFYLNIHKSVKRPSGGYMFPVEKNLPLSKDEAMRWIIDYVDDDSLRGLYLNLFFKD